MAVWPDRNRNVSVIVSKIIRLFKLEAELPMPASWVTFFWRGCRVVCEALYVSGGAALD